MADFDFAPDNTKVGYLPPWEVAKACAYHEVVHHVAEHLGEEPSKLLGDRVDNWIAGRLTLQGGGHPSARAVRNQIKLCRDLSWYPGKRLKTCPARQGKARKAGKAPRRTPGHRWPTCA